MKKPNFQYCKMNGRNNSGKTRKIALYLLFSIYMCIFLNIHAQKTISICKGNSVNLVPQNSTGTIVEWKDSSGNTLTRLDEKGIRITDLTPKVTPLVTATYTVKQVDAKNLIPNGNFDPPPTNPSSLSGYQYIPVPRNFNPDYARGFFTIQDNPQDLFDSTRWSPIAVDPGWRKNWYCSIGDHTTGHGNMFIANGGAGGTTVYTNTVNVTAGTVYYVGAWFANINVNFFNPYNMDIYVNGEKIGNLSGAHNDNWYQKYAFWTATTTGQVNLVFRNTQTANDGNDFAIDDIVFSPVVESTVAVKVNNPTSAPILNKTICQGDSVVFYGNAYKTSGTYSKTLVNAEGCDSVATLILIVTPASTSVTACESYTAVDGKTYTTSGIKTVVGKNTAGNDSIYQINLIIKHSTINTAPNITACDSYTAPDGAIYTTSQVLTKVIHGIAGCDSTINTNLTINKSLRDTISVTATNSYTAPDGQIYTKPGIKTAIIHNIIGCDSIISINLKVNTISTITVTGCDTYTAPDGQIYDTPGTKTAVIPNSTGCDSIITIVLIIEKGTTIHQTKDLFQGETYAINGNVYNQAGEYTDILVSKNGCDSVVVTTLKIIDLPNTITPNMDGKNDIFLESRHVKIYNRNGILLYEGNNGWDGTHNGIPVTQGTYFFVLYLASESKTKEGYITVVR